MNAARLIRALIPLAVGASSAITASANPAIYEQVLPSSVLIETGRGFGSGALIDLENRLVITCDHVVNRSTEVKVYFPGYDANGALVTDAPAYLKNFETLRSNGMAVKGRVVALWKEKDLALIELEALPSVAQPLPLATTAARPGDNVYCIGNSSIRDKALWRYTPGVVRNSYHRPQFEDLVDIFLLETNCALNPGDSGGPIVNENGELVGIVSRGDAFVKRLGNGRLQIRDAQMLVEHEIDVREVFHLLAWFNGTSQTAAMCAAAE